MARGSCSDLPQATFMHSMCELGKMCDLMDKSGVVSREWYLGDGILGPAASLSEPHIVTLRMHQGRLR